MAQPEARRCEQWDMRGNPESQAAIYHTFNVEDLIEPGHPLRPIERMVDRALADISRTFKAACSDRGRVGIPPKTLLRALLLQCLYTIRSERDLCRRLKTDLLFRWFLDLQPSDDVFDHSVFGWVKTVGGGGGDEPDTWDARRSGSASRWRPRRTTSCG